MKQSIKNFKQLVFMFNAGSAEFHFLNKKGRMFNLKFIKLFHDPSSPVSLVYTYFSKIPIHVYPGTRDATYVHMPTINNQKTYYSHIGRYDFKNKKLELRTDPVIPETGVKIAVEALGYILEAVNTGKDITRDITAYYSPRCCRCGHPLTNRVSLERGIGPECESFYKEESQLDLFNIT